MDVMSGFGVVSGLPNIFPSHSIGKGRLTSISLFSFAIRSEMQWSHSNGFSSSSRCSSNSVSVSPEQ